jgi:hypothetical protein
MTTSAVAPAPSSVVTTTSVVATSFPPAVVLPSTVMTTGHSQLVFVVFQLRHSGQLVIRAFLLHLALLQQPFQRRCEQPLFLKVNLPGVVRLDLLPDLRQSGTLAHLQVRHRLPHQRLPGCHLGLKLLPELLPELLSELLPE